MNRRPSLDEIAARVFEFLFVLALFAATGVFASLEVILAAFP